MKIIVSIIAVLLFVSVVEAQDTKVVTTEGVAALGSDPAGARDKAIEDALRRAVEQAVGTMVESETAVENYKLLSDKIYSRSAGYVKSYDILSENREGNLLRVKISATVSSGDLSNELRAIGLLQRRMKYPRVMVMIAEDNVLNTNSWNLYTVSNSQAEATVIQKLKAKGFNVVDPGQQRRTITQAEAMEASQGNYDSIGRTGKKLGAEIIIVGTATSTRSASNIAGSDLLSVSSTITASAIKAGTNQIMAQASSQGTAAHINEVAALQQSLQKASEKIGDDLITGILDVWQQETSGTRLLSVQVEDISPSELDHFKSVLESIPSVKEVLVRSFSEGSADIDVQAKTDAADLSAVLAKKKFNGFRLVLIESSQDKVEYRVVH